MEPTVIYNSDHLNCVCYQKDSENLSIVFDHMRIRDGSFPKHGYPNYYKNTALLHVHCRKNNWFLVPDLNKARNSLAAFTKRFSNITAFGSSMGGYGVILFSKEIKYDFVFLASPQFSISPEIAPFEKRFSTYLKEVSWKFEEKLISEKASLSGILIFDPSVIEDRLQKELFTEFFPNIEAVSFPFSGHPALSIFGETGRFGRLANLIVNRKINRENLVIMRRSLREKSITYLKNIQVYLDKRTVR